MYICIYIYTSTYGPNIAFLLRDRLIPSLPGRPHLWNFQLDGAGDKTYILRLMRKGNAQQTVTES